MEDNLESDVLSNLETVDKVEENIDNVNENENNSQQTLPMKLKIVIYKK